MSEYDETQLFPDMRLARILLERLGKNSLSVSVEVAAEKILDAQHTIADKDAEIARLNKRTDDLVGLFIGDDHESPLGKKVMSVLAPMAVDEESELEKVWADVNAIGVGYLYKSKRIDPVLLYAYGSKDTVSISKESAEGLLILSTSSVELLNSMMSITKSQPNDEYRRAISANRELKQVLEASNEQ